MTPKDPAGEQPTATATSEDGVQPSPSGPPAAAGRCCWCTAPPPVTATFDELVPHLENKRRVYRYDRRGRGLSGDGPSGTPYRLELEFADSARSSSQVVTAEGAPAVDVRLALVRRVRGAGRGSRGRTRYAASSPTARASVPSIREAALDRIETAVGQSDPDTALRLVFRDVIGMPPGGHPGAGGFRGVAGAGGRGLVRGTGMPGRRGIPEGGAAHFWPRSASRFWSCPGTGTSRPRGSSLRAAEMIPGAELDEPAAAKATRPITQRPAALASRCLRFFDETAGRTTYSGRRTHDRPAMKAIIIAPSSEGARYVLAEVPEPAVGPADLLVEVHASAINQADLRHASRHFAGSESDSGPAISGLEMAGEVIALGERATGFAVGDRVMAMTGRAWAERVAVDHRLAIPVPSAVPAGETQPPPPCPISPPTTA